MRFRFVPAALPLLLPACVLGGCEIVASFDRNHIKVDEPDVLTLLTGDGEVLGGGRDGAVLDGGLFDGSTTPPDLDADDDAGDDAASDEDAEIEMDAELDAAPDEPHDADAASEDDASPGMDAELATDAGDDGGGDTG